MTASWNYLAVFREFLLLNQPFRIVCSCAFQGSLLHLCGFWHAHYTLVYFVSIILLSHPDLARQCPSSKGKRKVGRRIKIRLLAKFLISKVNEYCARHWPDCQGAKQCDLNFRKLSRFFLYILLSEKFMVLFKYVIMLQNHQYSFNDTFKSI